MRLDVCAFRWGLENWKSQFTLHAHTHVDTDKHTIECYMAHGKNRKRRGKWKTTRRYRRYYILHIFIDKCLSYNNKTALAAVPANKQKWKQETESNAAKMQHTTCPNSHVTFKLYKFTAPDVSPNEWTVVHSILFCIDFIYQFCCCCCCWCCRFPCIPTHAYFFSFVLLSKYQCVYNFWCEFFWRINVNGHIETESFSLSLSLVCQTKFENDERRNDRTQFTHKCRSVEFDSMSLDGMTWRYRVCKQ